jgi:hypothetical protein
MSALPPKADFAVRQLDVRFVPKADITAPQSDLALFDNLVGGDKKTLRYRDAQRFGGF